MAVVRMSYSLKNDIQTSIKEMFSKRLSKAQEGAAKAAQELSSEVMNIVCPSEIRQLYKTHPGLIKYSHFISQVNIFASFNNDKNDRHTFNIILPEAVPASTSPNTYSGYNITYVIPSNHFLYEKLRIVTEPIRYVLAEQHTLIEEVQKTLSEAGSLKQVVDVWPSVMDFVPKHYKDRYYEPVEKKKLGPRTPLQIEEKLKTGLLIARLGSNIE